MLSSGCLTEWWWLVVVVVVVWVIFHTRTWDGGGYHHHHHHPRIVVSLWGRLHPPTPKQPLLSTKQLIRQFIKQSLLSIKQPSLCSQY